MEKWRFRMEIYPMIRRGSEQSRWQHRCTYICTMIFTVLLGLRAVCLSDWDREGREDWCWCPTTNSTNIHAMIKQFSQQIIMQHKFPAHHLIHSVISQNLLFICFRLYVFGRNNVIRVVVDNRKETGAVRWNNDVVFCCEKKRNEYMDKAVQDSSKCYQIGKD